MIEAWRRWRLRVWTRKFLIADGLVASASQTYGPSHVALCRRDRVERCRAEMIALEHLLSESIPTATLIKETP